MTGLASVRAFRAVSLLIAIGAALLLREALPDVELIAFDRRLALAGPVRRLDPSVQLVGIDDRSLAALGQWPFPRATHARLIRALGEGKAKAVGMDVMFLRPGMLGPEDDGELAAALGEARAGGTRVILACKVSGDVFREPVLVPPLPALAEAAAGSGFVNALPDPDGKYRAVVLAAPVGGRMEPSLDLLMAARALGEEPGAIRYEPGRIVLGRAAIPVDGRWRMLVNYPKDYFEGGAGPRFESRSYAALLEPGGAGRLAGRLVYVGVRATGLEDYKMTPYGPKPGVDIHAAALNTIVTGRFLAGAPAWANLAATLAVALAIGWAVPRRGRVPGTLVTAGILVLYTLANLLAFRLGLSVHLAGPLLAGLLAFLGTELAQFLLARTLFRQFVAAEVVDAMLASDAASARGGEEREVTILFSDIRGYTSLSEKMPPARVMQLLNEHHERMVAVIHEHGGRVFDYQGDAQAAMFGAPVRREDHALAAVRAALGMQEELRRLRERWALDEVAPIEMGIGLATGVAAVGIVGSEDRKQYTAIGDVVNVASRLQGLSRQLEAPVLASLATWEKVRGDVEGDALAPVALKGKTEPVAPYRIRSLRA